MYSHKAGISQNSNFIINIISFIFYKHKITFFSLLKSSGAPSQSYVVVGEADDVVDEAPGVEV